MKNNHLSKPRAQRAWKGLLLAGLTISPAILNAADWIGGAGPFGTSGNWSTGAVPNGTNANIINNGTATVTTGDAFTPTQISLGNGSSTGSLSMSGGSITGSHGDEWWIGNGGGTGTLTMTGGTLSNNNWIIFGRDSGSTGNATLSGDAAIVKTDNGNIGIGVNSGTTNTVTMSGTSTMTSNNDIRVGWLGGASTKGILNMSDDTVATANYFQIGQASATGEVHLTGNARTVATNEYYVGSESGSNGTLTMTDTSSVEVTNGFVVGRGDSTGVATVGGNAEVIIHGVNVVGDGGSSNATLTVNGNASVLTDKQLWLNLNGSTTTINVNGGLVNGSAVLDGSGLEDPTGAGVSFGRFGSGGAGTLNLNGGVLETPGFSHYTGTAQINLNGGTIKATGMTTTGSFFDSIASEDIDLQAGGAIFDTNGNDITIVQDLAGVGSLTKLGLGMLTFTGTPTYEGDTLLNDGTLTINNVYLADGANVFLTTGAILNLTFSGTDTINGLFLDNIALAPGVWGAIGNPDAEYHLSLITGTGTLTVVPEPAGVGAAIAAGLGLIAGLRRKRGRRND